MGFTLRHIQAAIVGTGTTGEVSAHGINNLATWMIEHPEEHEDPVPGGAAAAASALTDAMIREPAIPQLLDTPTAPSTDQDR